jgi:hypothetical protein
MGVEYINLLMRYDEQGIAEIENSWVFGIGTTSSLGQTII